MREDFQSSHYRTQQIRSNSMTKQFLLGVMCGLVSACLVFGVVATKGAPAPQGRGQRGPAGPPAPCGPSIAPPLGTNTAPNSRCFELRMYTVDESRVGQGNFKGDINDLHKRFREDEVEVFNKNGVDVMAVWQDLGDPKTLIYLLSYKDRAARDAGWDKFNVDPQWTELRNKYFVPLTTKVYFMSATDYSPLK